MGKTVDRISTSTMLSWGFVEGPVGLFKTSGDGKLEDFETAGPEGGKLLKEPRTREVPVERDEDAPPVPVDDGTREREVERLRQEENEANARLTVAARRLDALRPNVETVSYMATVEEGTGTEVEPGMVRRGVRAGDGSFIDLTDVLAEADRQSAGEEMRVVSFVRPDKVARARVAGSYYLASNGPGSPKVLRLLYEAMRATGRVAVVKWTKTSRQALGVVQPEPLRKGALTVLELVWAEDWRDPSGRCLTHQQAEVTAGEVAAAVGLVEAMSDSVASLDALEDDRRRLYREVKAAAELGIVPELTALPPRRDLDGLEAALLASAESADDFAAVA